MQLHQHFVQARVKKSCGLGFCITDLEHAHYNKKLVSVFRIILFLLFMGCILYGIQYFYFTHPAESFKGSAREQKKGKVMPEILKSLKSIDEDLQEIKERLPS